MAKKLVKNKEKKMTVMEGVGRIFAVAFFLLVIAAAIWSSLIFQHPALSAGIFLAVLIEEVSFYLIAGKSLFVHISSFVSTKLTPAEQAVEDAKAELEKENETSWMPQEEQSSGTDSENA